MLSSTDYNFGTDAYDSHGNLSSGSSTNTLEYDSSDRAVYVGQFSHNNSFDPVDRQYYDDAGTTYSVYSDVDDIPIAAYNNTFTLANRFLSLPGDVLLSINASGAATDGTNVYTLPNLHGDAMTSATGNGNPSNTVYSYDPYGIPNQPIGQMTNYPGSKEFGYLGRFGKLSDTFYWNSGNYMNMGSRMYIASLGRFAQVDPIVGGNDNAYVYPTDPINNYDLTGDSQRGRQGGSSENLSSEEQRLLDKYGMKGGGPRNRTERAIWNSAKKKYRMKQKFQGARKTREFKDKVNRNKLPDGPGKSSPLDEELPEGGLRLPFDFF